MIDSAIDSLKFIQAAHDHEERMIDELELDQDYPICELTLLVERELVEATWRWSGPDLVAHSQTVEGALHGLAGLIAQRNAKDRTVFVRIDADSGTATQTMADWELGLLRERAK